jgi:hypothetical protein
MSQHGTLLAPDHSDKQPPVQPFGASAVDANTHAGHLALALNDPATLPDNYVYAEGLSEYFDLQEDIEDEVYDFRVSLSSLTRAEASTFNTYMVQAPDSLREELGITHDNQWWLKLTYEAPHEQVFKVMQWHTDRLREQQQSPEFQRSVAEFKAFYADKVREGVKEGWLHEHALRFVDEIDDVEIFIGDMFETTLKGLYGYHHEEDGRRVIVLEQGKVVDEHGAIDRYIPTHEMTHPLGGFGSRWLKEAVDDHITMTMLKGKPDIIDPIQRRHDGGTYEKERILLGIICELGAEKIPASLFTRAFSAQGEEKERIFAEIKQAASRAWGVEDLFAEIDHHMALYEAEARKNPEITKDVMPGAAEFAVQGYALDKVIGSLQSTVQERRRKQREEFAVSA